MRNVYELFRDFFISSGVIVGAIGVFFAFCWGLHRLVEMGLK